MYALSSYSSDEESDDAYVPPVPEVKAKVGKSEQATNYDEIGMDISEESGSEEAEGGMAKSLKGQKVVSNVKAAVEDGKPDSVITTDPSVNKSPILDKNYGDPQTSPRSLPVEGSMSSSKGKDLSADRRLSQTQECPAKERSRDSNSKEKSDAGEMKRHRSRSPGYNRGKRRSRSRERYNRNENRGKSWRGQYNDRNSGRKYEGSRRRSHSRERRRSRSRDRRSRSRDRDNRRRSRSREAKRPIEIRKEAQQKLAALHAANPGVTTEELVRRSLEATLSAAQKAAGITLPSYYNPAAMNIAKFAEQERKKKLLWGNKPKPAVEPVPTAAPMPVPDTSTVGAEGGHQVGLWAATRFSNDNDGRVAEKFRRLMGVKGATAGPSEENQVDTAVTHQLEHQEELFSTMERQYEVARVTAHMQRGCGLGFSSQGGCLPPNVGPK